MKRKLRFVPRPAYEVSTTPFASAEEAWFWFIRCQIIRHQGGQPRRTSGAITRPCDPDDIYRAVMLLFRQQVLSPRHLRTLSQYGLAERPPDARCAEEVSASRLWTEALDQLEVYLSQKGIVDQADHKADNPLIY